MKQGYSQFERWRTISILVVFCTAAVSLWGQGSGGGAGSSQAPRAQLLTLSGLPQGGSSVQAQQNAVSGSSSNNTVNSTIQVQGAYQGSVRAEIEGSAALPLTLDEAIRLGLRYNLGGVASGASLQQLRGQRLAALAELLPNIYATISETGAKTDLQTQGLSTGTFGGNIPLPVTVGPYHYNSAQANLSEQLSLTGLHNLRAAAASGEAGKLNLRDARELIILAVGGSYLRVLATQALVASQQAQVNYADVSYKQAAAQNRAGTKATIDANRSLVELQTQQQRLSSQQADLMKQKMTLARLIGLPPGRELRIDQTLPSAPPPPTDLAAEIVYGLDHRADLRAADRQVKAAEESLHASHAEYLPSLGVNGYYGLQGVDPSKGVGVFQASASVNIPIFNFGRTRADVEQANAALTQRKAEYENQKDAAIDLQVAVQQVGVAESNRELSLSTLKQSQDRFAAGVTTSVEVVQSQESLASAETDYINALYSLNLAKISLARATGQAETSIPSLLKGQ